MKITIITGPNLNLLGKLEPALFVTSPFTAYSEELKSKFPTTELEYFQSNVEGDLVSKIQQAGFNSAGIILNAGAYTHTSAAIGDAVAAVPAPVIEVHISNVFAREEFRHKSFISPHCNGIIIGLGLDGYNLAIRHLQIQHSS